MAPSAEPASALEDPLIGRELAQAYRIARVLGEGAMGRLYEAEHLRLDRRFAIKVLHQPLAQRDDIRARFDREARVMSRIKSDHVVDVIDVTTAPDGRACIVTELLEGVDLERLLEARGRLPVGEAVSLMRQCLRGLSAAHALGIVHRDLKPSNLFCVRDASGRSTLKVLDFGVAKNSGEADLTAAGTIMGTPAYMAPEQARGARFADARSDLYAVGAVLYRLLTGRAPYDEEDVHGTLIRLMQEAPERPSALERTIPAGLEAIMERAMARDPDERYQSAAEFDLALAVFDSGPHDVALADAPSAQVGPSADAATLSRKARLVRPLAVATTALLGLAAGMATASILALFVAALEDAPRLGRSALWLVLIGGGASAALVLTFASRALRSAWRNAPAVQAFTRRFAYTLLGLATALGAQELLATVLTTCLLRRPAETDPLYACLRVAGATALAVAIALRTPRARAR